MSLTIPSYTPLHSLAILDQVKIVYRALFWAELKSPEILRNRIYAGVAVFHFYTFHVLQVSLPGIVEGLTTTSFLKHIDCADEIYLLSLQIMTLII